MIAKSSFFLICCSLLIAGCNSADQTNNGKIISINPCTDAILLALADPDQIGAISHYSHDQKSSSSDISLARKFPAIGQSAEEIIALKPALVLAGGHISASTLEALKQMDIKVLQSPVANSVAQSHEQIISIAKAIGQQERGAALVADINAILDAAKPPNGDRITAIVWQGGGLVPGHDTLIDEIMMRTGYDNVAQNFGLSQWDVIGLERLSATPPSIILRGGDDRLLGHPILDKIDSKIVNFPQSMIWCAGPTIAKAADRLAQIRHDYVQGNLP